jgi:hypothetical protein
MHDFASRMNRNVNVRHPLLFLSIEDRQARRRWQFSRLLVAPGGEKVHGHHRVHRDGGAMTKCGTEVAKSHAWSRIPAGLILLALKTARAALAPTGASRVSASSRAQPAHLHTTKGRRVVWAWAPAQKFATVGECGDTKAW